MAGMRREESYDDGHTIADMSDVRGAVRPEHRGSGDFSDELQSAEERWMVVLGTLRAALSIGMVYIVGFGIAIAVMVALWT